jgi:SAM-dependent methyltransferase
MGAADRTAGQDSANAAKNAGFFADNQHYAELIGSLEGYRHIRRVVDREIAGARRLLDIGNGGVFVYDTSLAAEIVGVDLFLDGTPPSLDEHITLRRGDALALAEPDGAYDVVLINSVLHHLIGTDVDSTFANIRRAIAEAHRVLEPGGRLIVVESCVSPRAFAVERHLFRPLLYLARTPLMSHPATLQFPPATIAQAIGELFEDVSVEPIPVGRWIVQFNLRWPTALTPARPQIFTGKRA